MRAFLPIAALLAALAVACGTSEEGATRPSPSPPVDLEAICAEHGVLQALCTRCNPALEPVFRARGDWCEEHDHPESICPLCHPERGGRPLAPLVATERVPAEGDVIFLRGEDSAARAGLSTAPVVARSEPRVIAAPARLAYDARRRAVLNARSPGVVATVDVELGQVVQAGQRLAVIESAEAADLRARLAAARERAQVAERGAERAESLHGERIGSERAVLEAQSDRAGARADVTSLEAAVRVLGAGGGQRGYAITSPIDGSVVALRATIGTFAGPGDVLFEVVDTSRLWAEVEVPETHAAALARGAPVHLAIEGRPELALTLEYVAPEVDPHARTVLARALVPNPDRTLRANALAEARVEVEPARDGTFVPRGAVQEARGHAFVFVPRSDDGFEVRRVRVVRDVGDQLEVEGRLTPGERVVVDGAFSLLSEVLPDALGAGCCAE